ncbi:MAG: hypothetical protein ACI9KE_001012 [Polyangiales bacterium]|jgi:hypothetical protein
MELGINLVLFAGLGLVWTALMPHEIEADFSRSDARRLGALERQLHEHPSDVPLLLELSTAYLVAERPGAAVATLRSAEPTALEHPALGRTLAQGYEALGRFDDALASARLTLDRCARALGASDGPSGTPVPRFRCSAREYARLSVHEEALRRIVAWDVVRLGDRRIAQAYDLAFRRVRIASAN